VRWLKLTDGLGLDRDYVVSTNAILPGTRFAVDAYVRFVQERSLLEAVGSSLTELFSPSIIGERVRGMLAHYAFIKRETLSYFEKRPPLAKRDSDFALDYVKRHATTPNRQRAVLEALEFKCGMLWSMLDVLYFAYVAPGNIPPGAFVPSEKHMERSDTDRNSQSRPKLRRGVRLTLNEAQGGWVLLAPEKIFKTDQIGAEILKRCNGTTTLDKIIDDLAVTYDASPQQIRDDVTELVESLAAKQLLDL
jgi:pyrroloquinoline quinone biosynthesis protein D